jgi:hypothetical protein
MAPLYAIRARLSRNLYMRYERARSGGVQDFKDLGPSEA